MTAKNILFLCNHNSARSIMAEAVLNDIAGGRFRAFSAGVEPGNGPHPMALETLKRHGHPTSDARSKDTSEFTAPGSPKLDYVITLCDRAVLEECPNWPGQPERAHWRLPNPAAATGTEAERLAVFEALYQELHAGLMVFATEDERSLLGMALAS